MTINPKHIVVVSRFREDVEWVNHVPARVILYNKGPALVGDQFGSHVTLMTLPNVGREGETFLSFIVHALANMQADIASNAQVTFLQGNPFEHSPHCLELLRDISRMHREGMLPNNPLSLSLMYTPAIPPPLVKDKNLDSRFGEKTATYTIGPQLHLQDWTKDSGIDTCIRTYRVASACSHNNIVHHFLERCGLTRLIRESYKFAFSACFTTSMGKFNNLSAQEWGAVRRELLLRNNQGGPEGYVLERLWLTLLE